MDFLEKVTDDLRPDTKVLKEIDQFIEKINSLLKKSNIKATCVKGGSVAKGTFLKNDFDVDLFVKFDQSYKEKDISSLLKKAIKSFDITTLHGSRDYFQYKKNNLTYELVPVLELKSPKDAANVTDMSPLHVDWVKSNIKKGQEDEIRLAKQFSKSAKVYGAESYINGFSGHVIDILVIYYGGFLPMINAVSKWKEKTVIDTKKALKNPLFELNKSKTLGPLVIVDPILSSRNAAAALSKEKFDLFIDAAKRFLKKPSKEFFEIKTFSITDIKKSNKENKVISISIQALEGKRDVVGSKLLKTYNFLKKELIKNGFKVIDSDWKWDRAEDAEIYFVMSKTSLSKKFVKKGPPTTKKDACADFKKKYKDTFEKEGSLYANADREYVNPEDLLTQKIKDNYIKDKIKKIKLDKP